MNGEKKIQVHYLTMNNDLIFQGLKDGLVGIVPEISLEVKGTFNIKLALLLGVTKVRRGCNTFERGDGRVRLRRRRGI